jgi:hypothetical protein
MCRHHAPPAILVVSRDYDWLIAMKDEPAQQKTSPLRVHCA